MEAETNMQLYFADYPAISAGLKKLKIEMPTDFQQQLLELDGSMDNLIITAPETTGKTVGLLLHALRRFTIEEQGILVVLTHSK
jgi:superfamily II DNA/RNA helicase